MHESLEQGRIAYAGFQAVLIVVDGHAVVCDQYRRVALRTLAGLAAVADACADLGHRNSSRAWAWRLRSGQATLPMDPPFQRFNSHDRFERWTCKRTAKTSRYSADPSPGREYAIDD